MPEEDHLDSYNLFKEFKTVSRKEWEKVISQDLNGENYKELLLWESDEGFSALPFYTREDLRNFLGVQAGFSHSGEPHTLAGSPLFAEDITTSDIIKSNKLACEAIQNGVNILLFTTKVTSIEGLPGGGLYGIPIQTQVDIQELLKGIDLRGNSLFFDTGMASIPLMGMLWNEIERQNLNPENISAYFSFDPFTSAARSGRWPQPTENLQTSINEAAGSPFRSLGIDGTFYHHCGATMTQEVGITLSIFSEFLAVARQAGADLRKLSRSFFVRLSSGSYYFPEIAKFRAARILMDKIFSAYADEAGNHFNLKILAETSPWTKTVAEPHNNILRAVTESMAAIAGGADLIRILPFDIRFRKPNGFSRRLSRNIHHILQYESNFNGVSDPGAGSYYIEYLTDEIANKSWDFFQFIEKQGGFFKALEGGFIQLAVEKSRKEKLVKIRKRDRIFIGSNHYTNPDENLPDLRHAGPAASAQIKSSESIPDKLSIVAIKSALQDGAAIGEIIKLVYSPQKQRINPLEPWYATQELEQLRSRIQKFMKNTDRSINVVILPFGTSRIRNSRASFTRNYLGAAGYHMSELTGMDTLDQATDEISLTKPEIVVLSSSDKEYKQLVGIFCTELFDKMKTRPLLLLAGQPEEFEKYRELGIDGFIHHKSDMIETLNNIQQKLEERLQ